MIESTAPPAPREVIYHWAYGFVSFATGLVMESGKRPYRRMAVTLLVSLDTPFLLDAGDVASIETTLALIAPQTSRRRLLAENARLVIFDLSAATPEYRILYPLVARESVRTFPSALLQDLGATLARGFSGELSPDELRELLDEIVARVAAGAPEPEPLHPRIAKALELIENTPLDELSLSDLADKVHLSASRLRHLFVEKMGFTLSAYARYRTATRAMRQWMPGKTLIDVAVGAGLHDTSHAHRLMREILGRAPSDYYDSERFTLVRCDW